MVSLGAELDTELQRSACRRAVTCGTDQCSGQGVQVQPYLSRYLDVVMSPSLPSQLPPRVVK